MNGVRSFFGPHKITMWIVLKTHILYWSTEYQRKGVVKLNLSNLFFCGQFRRSWKRLNWKNLLLTLIAVTRIINLVYFWSYFWRLLIFRWTLYKAESSIKRTLLSCTNGVYFIEIPLWLLKWGGGGGGRGGSQNSEILSERSFWMPPKTGISV